MCVNKHVSKNVHKEVTNTKVCLLIFYKIAEMPRGFSTFCDTDCEVKIYNF
jgi:hypothetical protein